MRGPRGQQTQSESLRLRAGNSKNQLVMTFVPFQLPFRGTLAALGLACALGCLQAAAQTQFVIEAEDFDYNKGQTKPEASVMPYLGGAYNGLSAVHNVDYHRNDNQTTSNLYRQGESPNVPMIDNPDLDRGAWKVTVNYRLGWINGGEWFNYTRDFPPGHYRVLAALSHSGTDDHLLRGAMERVISGAGTQNQQIQELGTFDAPGSGQWGLNNLVPLKTPDGEDAVIELRGKTTIRFTAGSGDIDYYKFIAVLPPQITAQPQDLTVEENEPAVFTVEAANTDPVHFQWQSNRVDLAGANAAVYRIEATPLSADGARYRCVLTNATGQAITREALLHVTPDHKPPRIDHVQNIGDSLLQVVFTERVRAPGATEAANYRVTPGVTVMSARFGADSRTVILTLTPLTFGKQYTLTVNNIQDMAVEPNTIAPDTQAVFTAVEYAPRDIGGPAVAGGSEAAEGGYNVSGSGEDIGGVSDQFHFEYRSLSGNFDLRVRLAGFTPANPFAKAGLMARNTLTANSAFAAVFAAPGSAGCFFMRRSKAGQEASSTGRFPVNYPSLWLRLKREGDRFRGYGSWDGTEWVLLGEATVAMDDPIYVGQAVTSRNPQELATAEFRDIGPVAEAEEAAYFNPPREPLAPSSRLTRVVISEIMYHPRARDDGRDLEFIELANPDPIPEDLSGWRLTGDISFTFPQGTILQPDAFLVVARTPKDVQAVYGIDNVLGPYEGSLSNNGGAVRLRNRQGAILLEVPFSDRPPWPAAADGAGHSLVLARPSYGEGFAQAWAPSGRIGGSPGRPDGVLSSPWDGAMINEFLAHTDEPQLDFIEVYNSSSREIDLSGCFLTDDPSTNRFRIPDGTRLPAGGFVSFDQNELGFALNAGGESIFLIAADGEKVLDAVRFEGQANGRSSGRVPDGAPGIQPLAEPTPGEANAEAWTSPVVINEIMYNPISADDNEEYVELYNRGEEPVDLSGWRFTDGISFTFPEGVELAPDSYLVVAKNAARLRENHPQLNEENTLGDYQGRLADDGERIALAQPDLVVSTNAAGVATTNTIYIIVNEVTYRTGGRWGKWSDGGGSSLELIDPRADNRLASNWADSDETQKAPWTTVEVTGRLDNGNSKYSANRLYILLLGAGECLVDDVSIARTGGSNLINNGGFESGGSGWSLFGRYSRSFIQVGGAASGNRCLHILSDGDGDTGPNSIRASMTSSLRSGNTATIRAKVRWLAGWPQILFRIRGNWLELPGQMEVPKNLGTPGLPNSRRAANAGPAIWDATHTPALPRANQHVYVTARASDPDGVGAVRLVYRVDPSSTFTQVWMNDTGTAGDAKAGDGIYTARIPGKTAGTLVAFRIEAFDRASPGARTVFPAGYPDQECLIRWGDPIPTGNFTHYHLWSTKATRDALNSANGLDNTWRDATLVYRDCRVIYNVGYRHKGSPYHGGRGDYAVTAPKDDLLLGTTDRVFGSTGNGGSEATAMRGQLANWFAEQLDIPFLPIKYMQLFLNGSQFRNVTEDLVQPNRYYARRWFPQGTPGDLYKVAVWFEFADNNSSFAATGATLQEFKTTGGQYKPARYRWNWQIRPDDRDANDFEKIFDLAHAANVSTGYVEGLFDLAEMEEWMRIFAWNRVTGNWDSWAFRVGQNMFLYKRPQYRWVMIPWDIDFVLGIGNGPSDGLWGGQDPVVNRMFNTPAFQRAMWRAYQDAVNGPMQPERYEPQIQARRDALLANGVSGLSDPQSIRSYIEQRRNYIQSQIEANDVSELAITTAQGKDFSVTTPAALLTGRAPFAAASLAVNGKRYPVQWSGRVNWRVQVPLWDATNHITVTGLDRFGNPIPGMSDSITVFYQGELDRPEDFLVINEIHYHPAQPGEGFVELFNRSQNTTFDLSRWRLNGTGFVFPDGAMIGPQSYLLVAADRAAFEAAYGAGLPIAGEFPGALDNGGETLSLVRPDPQTGEELVVDTVRYDDDPPWPPEADGLGSSLQLIDPAEDNWRAGNWAAASPDSPDRVTPGAPNSVSADLPPFPPLWINEVLASNAHGLTDGAGEHEPWIEIYNAGDEELDLGGLYLSHAYTNLTEWAFPTGTLLPAKRFLVVWADGETNETAGGEIHAGFRLPQEDGSVALTREQPGGLGVIDCLDYRLLGVDRSYGSYPDGQSKQRRVFDYPTPGTTNNPASKPVQVFINEWMAVNTTAVADPADGDFDDWFELYNAGPEPVDLTDFTLTDDPADPTLFRIPPGFIIPPGEFLIVWADGEPGQSKPGEALHANFRLNADGEQIALYAPDGSLVDGVEFGPQTADLSEGRLPDGAPPPFAALETPTPGAPNGGVGGNRPPSIKPIPDQAIAEGQTLAFDVAAEDPDPDQTLSFSMVNAPVGAQIDESTGRFEWTPAEDQGPGVYTFSIWVTDDGAPRRSATAAVAVTVVEVNRPPQLDPLPDLEVPEGQPLAVTNRAVDLDIPPNRLTFRFASDPPPGMTMDPDTGLILWTPSEDQGEGVYPIIVRVEDDGSPVLADETAFTIHVLDVDNPPVIEPIPDRTVTEGLLITFDVKAHDPDSEAAPIRFALEGDAPEGARIDPVTGVFSWTPSEEQGPGNYRFLVRATEQTAAQASSTQSFFITVNEDNAPPTLEPIEDQTVREGELLAVTVRAADPDLPPQQLIFSLQGSPPQDMKIDPAAGLLTWPVPADFGPTVLDLTVRVADNGEPSLQAERSFRLTVLPQPHLVLNEILCRPAELGGQFIEIINNSAKTSQSLEGVRLLGSNLQFAFPEGELAPGQFLLLVQDAERFAALYPKAPQTVIAGEFSGALNPQGDTLRLIRTRNGQVEEILDEVRYQTSWPWPQVQPGSSLQLADALRDNRRPANWRSIPHDQAGETLRLTAYTNLWKYIDTGEYPGEGWKAPDYDDSTWPSGPGLLYHEESGLPGPKNTPIDLGPTAFYFRSAFDYFGPTEEVTLRLQTILDDGAVIYLNGQEIYRLGMPEGEIAPDTFANRTVGNAAVEGPFEVPGDALRVGRNILAVEVHQHSATSSDVVWGLQLEVAGALFAPATPGAANAGVAPLPRFPSLWINEIEPDNRSTARDSAGEAEPWAELVNAGPLPVLTEGLRLETEAGGRRSAPGVIRSSGWTGKKEKGRPRNGTLPSAYPLIMEPWPCSGSTRVRTMRWTRSDTPFPAPINLSAPGSTATPSSAALSPRPLRASRM